MKTVSLPLSPVRQHPASFLQLSPRRSNRQAAGEQRDDSIALARWALQELLTANLHHSCTRITLKGKLTEMTTYFNLYKFTTPFLYISWFIIFSTCRTVNLPPTVPPPGMIFLLVWIEIPQDSTHYHHHHLEMLVFLRFIVKSADCRFKVHYIITLTSLSIT